MNYTLDKSAVGIQLLHIDDNNVDTQYEYCIFCNGYDAVKSVLASLELPVSFSEPSDKLEGNYFIDILDIDHNILDTIAIPEDRFYGIVEVYGTSKLTYDLEPMFDNGPDIEFVKHIANLGHINTKEVVLDNIYDVDTGEVINIQVPDNPINDAEMARLRELAKSNGEKLVESLRANMVD